MAINAASTAPSFEVGQTLEVLGDRVTLKAAAPDTGGTMTVLDVVAPPGSGPPPHTHMQAEVFLVTEGTLEVLRDGGTHRLAAGDVLAVPCGTTHTYRNASGENARFLAVLHPAGHERFLAELAALGGPPEPQQILDVASRHGVRFAA